MYLGIMPQDILQQYRNSIYLIDVDGVVLPAGTKLRITEPAGFGEESGVVLTRNEETHGIYAEYGNEETTLSFGNIPDPITKEDTGRSLIEAIYQSKGFDGNIGFLFTYIDDTNTELTLFEGFIDLETRVATDVTTEVRIIRQDFDDKFRTRNQTEIPFASIESLDGNPIDPLVPTIIPLFSQPLLRALRYEYGIPGSQANAPVLDTFNISGNDSGQRALNYFQTGLPTKSFNSFDEGWFSVSPGFAPRTFNPRGDVEQFAFSAPIFRAENQGVYTFRGKLIPTITIDSNVIEGTTDLSCPGVTGTIDRVLVRAEYFVVSGEGLTLNDTRNEGYVLWKFDYSACAEGDSINSIDTSDPAYSAFITGNGIWSDETFALSANSQVYLQTYVVLSGTYDAGLLSTATIDFDYTGEISTDSYFEIVSAKTSTASSFSNLYTLYDVMRHHLQAITDVQEPLDAPILEPGNDQGMVRVGSGRDVRGFPVEEAQSSTTWDSLYQDVKARGGLGYDVRTVNGSPVVRVRRFEFFYSDDVSIVFDASRVRKVGDVDTPSTTEDTFNRFLIGYENYPNDDRTEAANTQTTFNGQQELQTPIVKVANEYTSLSPYVGSGELIEQTRRNQYQDGPQSGTPDDEKIFLFTTTTVDTFYPEVVILGPSEFPSPFASPEFLIRVEGALIEWNSALTITIDATTYNITGRQLDLSTSVSYFQVDQDVTLPSGDLDQQVTGAALQFGPSITWEGPESNEPFITLDGVLDPNKTYNARWAPKYNWFNHSLLFNSGFFGKDNDETVTTQRVRNFGPLRTQFKVGAGTSTLDPVRLDLTHDAPIEIGSINQRQRLFLPERIRFNVFMTWEEVMLIKENPYDLVGVEWYDGVVLYGYIMNFEFALSGGEGTIGTFIIKRRYQPPT